MHEFHTQTEINVVLSNFQFLVCPCILENKLSVCLVFMEAERESDNFVTMQRQHHSNLYFWTLSLCMNKQRANGENVCILSISPLLIESPVTKEKIDTIDQYYSDQYYSVWSRLNAVLKNWVVFDVPGLSPPTPI